jgi:CBS domain-containing membrane protein
MTVSEPWVAIGLSVTCAMVAMMMMRAIHPPAAGVALGVVLSAETVRETGFAYAFNPVMLDTALLLLVAVFYNHLTGRVYPFRQPIDHAPRTIGETGLRPTLKTADLSEILQRLGLDANIGAGDLARLIEAAHMQAAEHLFDGVETAQIMSRKLITAHPRMPVSQIAALLRLHQLRTIPVVGFDGQFQGLVSESDLVRTLHQPEGKPGTVMTRMLRASRAAVEPVAGDVMERMIGTVSEVTPLGVLIDLLAEGAQQVVPVLDDGRLIGLVSRADLIAALAKAHHPTDQSD